MLRRFFQWLERRRDDRLFTAVANAEHEAWLDRDHKTLEALRVRCIRSGKMDLYDRACSAAQRERDRRYRD